jgi:muramoyltetrapeptide carboxypeptidase
VAEAGSPAANRLPGIGVFSPSGRANAAQVAAGVAVLEAMGHRVVTSPQALLEWRYFGGPDAARAEGFHRLLDDRSVDILIASRGGYGLTRILPRIDWRRVRAARKALVGFSDFTALNCGALARAGLASFHGPMVGVDFGNGAPDPFMRAHFEAVISGAGDSVDVDIDPGRAAGRIDGTLWGGNLSLLAHLVGTPFLPRVPGGILYVEEIGEQPYAVERMFVHLAQAGVLRGQRAILLGDFTDCTPTNAQRYAYTMAEVVETLREIAGCPVLEGLPFGHVARKLTLPFGMPGRLTIRSGGYTLSWPGLPGR